MHTQYRTRLRVGACYGGNNASPWIRFNFVDAFRTDVDELSRLMNAISPSVEIQQVAQSPCGAFIVKPVRGAKMTRFDLQDVFFRLARQEKWKVRGQDD